MLHHLHHLHRIGVDGVDGVDLKKTFFLCTDFHSVFFSLYFIARTSQPIGKCPSRTGFKTIVLTIAFIVSEHSF